MPASAGNTKAPTTTRATTGLEILSLALLEVASGDGAAVGAKVGPAVADSGVGWKVGWKVG
jgi:hypothetical protein